jgi:SRSO17 transposase
MKKIVIYCFKYGNNQSSRIFVVNSPWSSTDLQKSVRTKVTKTIENFDRYFCILSVGEVNFLTIIFTHENFY